MLKAERNAAFPMFTCGSIPCRDRQKLLKQVVKAPLTSARQQVRALRFPEDDHYKRITHVTVGVTR